MYPLPIKWRILHKREIRSDGRFSFLNRYVVVIMLFFSRQEAILLHMAILNTFENYDNKLTGL